MTSDSSPASGAVFSIFPGIGMLDMAFAIEGFFTCRGPDLLWGGDVRDCHPPPGTFAGVIGGPPCQDFSKARRDPPTGMGVAMMREFGRVVSESQPEWFVCENVPAAPLLAELCELSDYAIQAINVDQQWYTNTSRLRKFQFGSRSGRTLDVPIGTKRNNPLPAALASDGRSFQELCDIQGLPPGFDLPGFTVEEKKRAVGNGVPIVLGRVIARAVRNAHGAQRPYGSLVTNDGPIVEQRLCACGCQRPVTGSGKYARNSAGKTDQCRQRAKRIRDTAGKVT